MSYNGAVFHVAKEIHFCYGHRLLNYAGKCRYFHGHNGKVEVQLSAETLDDQGMVRDFAPGAGKSRRTRLKGRPLSAKRQPLSSRRATKS